MQTGNVLTRSQNTSRSKNFTASASNNFNLKAPFYLESATSFNTNPIRFVPMATHRP